MRERRLAAADIGFAVGSTAISGEHIVPLVLRIELHAAISRLSWL